MEKRGSATLAPRPAEPADRLPGEGRQRPDPADRAVQVSRTSLELQEPAASGAEFGVPGDEEAPQAQNLLGCAGELLLHLRGVGGLAERGNVCRSRVAGHDRRVYSEVLGYPGRLAPEDPDRKRAGADEYRRRREQVQGPAGGLGRGGRLGFG